MDKKDYIKKYSQIYKNIPDQKKAIELIDKLSDVLVMMDECKSHIDSEGCVTDMCQGNYTIQRESPWSKVYDAKTKIMIALLDKLDKLMPDSKSENINKAGENLARLVASGRPVEMR